MFAVAALATELGKPEYSGLETQAAANAINAKRIPGPVTPGTVRQYLMLNGVWTALLTTALNTALPAQLRALAQTVLDVCGPGTFQDYDLHKAEMQAAITTMLTPLKNAQVITQAHVDGLFALSANRAGWAQTVLGRDVDGADIEAARAML